MKTRMQTAYTAAAGGAPRKKQSKALDVWRRLRKNRGAVIGLIIILVIIIR